MELIDLSGKVAVVTGSSRGWGLGIAKEMARRGARLVVTGTDSDLVDRAHEEVKALGPGCVSLVADFADDPGGAGTKVVEAAVEAFGRIDILVNNAGRVQSGLLLEMTDEAWNRVMNVQLNVQFFTTRLAARHMVKQGEGGRIINMVGGGAFAGLYANSNHTASKGGGMAAVLTWAKELAAHRITVNGIAATVDTDQSRPMLDLVRAKMRESGRNHEIPARDFGFVSPEEAAAAVVWLASDDASGISGHYIQPYGATIQIWRQASIERVVHHVPCWTPEALSAAGMAAIVGHVRPVDPFWDRPDAIVTLER